MEHLASIKVLDDNPPALSVGQSGTVYLVDSLGRGLNFRTLAAFDAWLEDIDRQRAAIGFTASFDEPLPGLRDAS